MKPDGAKLHRRLWKLLKWSTVGAITVVISVLAWATWSGIRMEARFANARPAGSSSTTDDVRSDSASVRLRIVGYNTWALPVWLPGMIKHERLPKIPEALADLDADVIALQEAFDVRFRPFMLESLDAFAVGENTLCEVRMTPWGRKDCTGGLMTLSRFPILAERFYQHIPSPNARADERKGGKGFMVTTIVTVIGPVDIANIHLYAGRTEADEAERMGQIRRFAQVLVDREADRPVVIVADLNVVHPSLEDPETGLPPSQVYRFMVDSLGFVDTRPEVGEAELTYDRETNPYANVWYNRFEGRQVFDYVMYRVPLDFSVSVGEQTRVLDGAEPLSDHYGTFTDLVIHRTDLAHGNRTEGAKRRR
jgi:endonuclease/exonuclease/phosphatase family metal-dependent hydrolase